MMVSPEVSLQKDKEGEDVNNPLNQFYLLAIIPMYYTSIAGIFTSRNNIKLSGSELGF